MSLTGALNSAVSALRAQSTAIAIAGDNLANSGTYGYKATSASFESLLTAQSPGGSYASGGVVARSVFNISAQGMPTSTGRATDLAISGNGFFPVSDGVNGSAVYYTRNGEFSVNKEGYLVNGGYYLLGWPTDANGNATSRILQPIDVDAIASTASPTTEAAIKANLPADAAVGDTFTTSMPLYDSLGTAHNCEITWTKTADNTWTADFADPVRASGSPSTASGTISGSPITISFNDDGTLASTSPNPPSISVSGWTTGAADSTIAIDLGTAGTATGLSQYDSDSATPDIDLDSITPNGAPYGKLSGITVDETGTVVGSYSNGEKIPLFKIPVATFANPNGLNAVAGGIYAESSASGISVLQESGKGGAGSVMGGYLEASTTDTNAEFTNIMTAQQAYSAAAQVITAVDDMFDTLLSAVR